MMAVALGTASHLASKRLTLAKIAETRDYFWSALKEVFGDNVIQNGDLENRLPNTLNVSFIGRDGSKILEQLDGFAASTGSACHEDSVTMSPVLAAMGLSDNVAMGAIRFSVDDATTPDEIDLTVKSLAAVVPTV